MQEARRPRDGRGEELPPADAAEVPQEQEADIGIDGAPMSAGSVDYTRRRRRLRDPLATNGTHLPEHTQKRVRLEEPPPQGGAASSSGAAAAATMWATDQHVSAASSSGTAGPHPGDMGEHGDVEMQAGEATPYIRYNGPETDDEMVGQLDATSP